MAVASITNEDKRLIATLLYACLLSIAEVPLSPCTIKPPQIPSVCTERSDFANKSILDPKLRSLHQDSSSHHIWQDRHNGLRRQSAPIPMEWRGAAQAQNSHSTNAANEHQEQILQTGLAISTTETKLEEWRTGMNQMLATGLSQMHQHLCRQGPLY